MPLAAVGGMALPRFISTSEKGEPGQGEDEEGRAGGSEVWEQHNITLLANLDCRDWLSPCGPQKGLQKGGCRPATVIDRIVHRNRVDFAGMTGCRPRRREGWVPVNYSKHREHHVVLRGKRRLDRGRVSSYDGATGRRCFSRPPLFPAPGSAPHGGRGNGLTAWPRMLSSWALVRSAAGMDLR